MRLVPASLPSGVNTSQSPSQKSNCLACGAEQGAAAVCAEAASGAARPIAAATRPSARENRFMDASGTSGGPHHAHLLDPHVAERIGDAAHPEPRLAQARERHPVDAKRRVV